MIRKKEAIKIFIDFSSQLSPGSLASVIGFLIITNFFNALPSQQTSILCYVEKLCLRQEACLASVGFAFFTSRRVPSQSKSKTIVGDVRTVRKWNCQCFHCPTRRRHRHSRWIFHCIKMMPGATQARHFSKRRRKPSWTIEERVVLHNIVVAEARKREIEIKEDSMDTVPGVNKIKLFVFIRDWFYDQIAIRWKVYHGCVFFANKLKSSGTTALGLLAFYPERKVDIGCVAAASYCWAILWWSMCLDMYRSCK